LKRRYEFRRERKRIRKIDKYKETANRDKCHWREGKREREREGE
jgi:hypothetical protein